MLNKDTNLIIGKINSGKTKGILFSEMKRIITNDESFIVLDNRGEYYKTFGDETNKKGYNTLVINLDNPSLSNGYNPLLLPYKLYKNGNFDDCSILLKKITTEIFKEDKVSNSDPFWENMASDYVAGLILTMFKTASEEEINFGSLGTMLNHVNKKYKDSTIFKTYLDNLSPLDSCYVLSSATEYAPLETRESILSVVRQKLNIIFMKENLLNMLSVNDGDLDNVKDKTAIFIIGNNNVANMFLGQLLYVLKKKSLLFNIILDNLDSYSRIVEMRELVENASYNGLKVNVAIRSLEEIEDKYGKYIFDKFQNVIMLDNNNLELLVEGSYDEYPEIKIVNNKYFDFEEYVKENFN